MKIKSPRHGSRSSSKGRIVKGCPMCGGILIIKWSDHYSVQAECNKCGYMKDEHRYPNGIYPVNFDKLKRGA